MRFRILMIAAFLAAFLTGCVSCEQASTRHSLPQPAVVMEVLDPSLEQYANAWQKEVGRRFSHAVVLLMHGGDFQEGRWIIAGAYANGQHVQPIQNIVRHYQAMYPDRVMVVLACNTGHLHIGIPGVFYAASEVWTVPDRGFVPDQYAPAWMTLNGYLPILDDTKSRWAEYPDVVGNVFELSTD